ncbi:Aorsin [Dactylella cylindrospora]|nr:Aorsin [Dactylella cylindrospora]
MRSLINHHNPESADSAGIKIRAYPSVHWRTILTYNQPTVQNRVSLLLKMRFSTILAAFPALLGLSQAHPLSSISSSYETFESLSTIPRGWEEVSGKNVDPSTPIKLRIHMKQQNVADFERVLLDMSTPSHPSYGNHMRQEEINAMLRPHEDTFASVKDWLRNSGFTDNWSINHNWIVISTTVDRVETLLEAKYKYFRNTNTGDQVIRTMSYSVPSDIRSHITMIQPTTLFGRVSAMKSTISTISSVEDADSLRTAKAGSIHDGLDPVACNKTITPDCLAALYKYKHFRPSIRRGNKIGINGFLEQYAQNDDLSQFLKEYKPNAENFTFTCAPVNGGLCTQHPQDDFTEANLDIQYTVSATYPTPNIYFSTAGRPPVVDLDPNTNEPYLEWLEYVLALSDDKLPQTITTSYGDDEHTVPESYARNVCNLFAQLGARGVSILFSSGDSGPGSECLAPDGKTKAFVPTFPATCPFVTSVGGTIGVQPERAVVFSSGGFSNYFTRPAYQNAAVEKYMATQSDAKTWASYYNASGRAFPDVAAQGARFHVIVGGSDQLVSGTSASSPAFAAIVALLNGDRLSKGKKPLGFLNPWLYSTAAENKGLTDVTVGTSSGCRREIPGAGWKATDGWDPVTGLGTPDFKVLQNL